MQFTITARDDTLAGTLETRLAFREEPMKHIHAMKAEGTVIDDEASSFGPREQGNYAAEFFIVVKKAHTHA